MVFQTTLLAAVCPWWFLEHFSFRSLIFQVSMAPWQPVPSMLSNTGLVRRRGKVFSCPAYVHPLYTCTPMLTHAHPHMPMYTHVASSTAHRNSQPQADLPTWVIIALLSNQPLWSFQLLFVKNNFQVKCSTPDSKKQLFSWDWLFDRQRVLFISYK